MKVDYSGMAEGLKNDLKKAIEQNKETLKTCPFCGGEAEFVRDIERKDIFQSSDYVYVRCKQCQVQTKKIYYSAELHKLDEEYALAEKAWNNRKPLERVIEKLENEVKDLHEDCNYIDAYKYEEAIKIIKEELI